MSEKREVQATPEQQYLQSLFDKYNKDPYDGDISNIERNLLSKVVKIEKEVSAMAQEYIKLTNEVKERQEKMNILNQQVVQKRGQSQGIAESLLALRDEKAEPA